MIQDTEILPAAPKFEKGKASRIMRSLAAFLLNLTGVGLGYMFLRRKLRWRIHFLVTCGLIVTVAATSIYRAPLIWSTVFGVWLLWMGVDGGIQAWRVAEDPPSGLPRLWLVLVLAVVIFCAESTAYFFYNLSALYSFQYGVAAYQAGDCYRANQHFEGLQNWSRLALSVKMLDVEEKIVECRLLLHVENSFQYGVYEEAISAADKYLQLYPLSPIGNKAAGAAANAFRKLGAIALEKGEFETALQNYQIALERYPQSNQKLELRGDISALYLHQGDQLAQNGKLEEAVKLYQEILNNYPETQAAKQTAVKAAAAYARWGDLLFEQGDHIQAMEKYQIVLDDYSWVSTVQPSVEKVTAGLTEWGDQLLSQGDYPLAIEKYQSLLNKYRSTISQDMLNFKIAEIYYQWAIDLRSKKDYEGAFNKYGAIMQYYTDTPVAERAKPEVPQTYFDWVAELQSNDRYDEALEKLNLVIKGFEDESVRQKGREGILENYLLWGKYFYGDKKYLEALEKYSIIIKDETTALAYLEKAEPAYQEALMALASDTGGQGYDIFAAAYRNACGGKSSTSPAIDITNDQAGKSLVCPENVFDVPVDLWADRPIDFRFVIKAVYGSQEVESCEYSSGYTLTRKRNQVDVTVISTRSGAVVASNRFYGGYPENCTGKFFFTENNQTIYGSTDYGYEDWFRHLSTYTVAKP